ncbi:hypothetical protein DIT68_02195 [Brumimicrobium oceani]|uniref:DUF2141 domain-containing protein n=1 Tax=Brumimicrobium oceani TaxID=2100725 RepID=A0A2U2XH24_9FLAO|nr:hypothetical protein DIT68_02195 [Brumimicrobium oceani]
MFGQEKSATLIIEVVGMRNNTGKIIGSVFNSKSGFPGTPNLAKYLVEQEITNNSSRIKIENVPFGNYGVSLVHDENSNQRLDTNFIGIPKEGIGMSNNAEGSFGPPSFEEASFEFSKKAQTIQIRIKYY